MSVWSRASGGGASVPARPAERRDELAERLAELQWDLGGLAYEMAIRDHFRLDVLMRRGREPAAGGRRARRGRAAACGWSAAAAAGESARPAGRFTAAARSTAGSAAAS